MEENRLSNYVRDDGEPKRNTYAEGVLSCQQIRVKLQSPRAFK